jgi:hypothetical protein
MQFIKHIVDEDILKDSDSPGKEPLFAGKKGFLRPPALRLTIISL